jgi:hypothetical protein
VVQHWMMLVGCWQAPVRSVVKASMAVGWVVVSYALCLTGPICSIDDVLQASKRAMRQCRLDHSQQHISTARLLDDLVLSC